MTTALARVTRLLAAVAGTAHLPLEGWLEARLPAAPLEAGAFPDRLPVQLQRAFPELPYSPAMLAKLWSLYVTAGLHSQEVTPCRDIGFVHFVLGMPKLLRKGAPVDAVLAARLDHEGERIERAVLAT